MNFIFELCAENLQAAKTAEQGGASRIELCSHLSIGGITPDEQLLTSTLSALTIPVHVLIRPRGGNFVYDEAEFALMRQQVIAAKLAGAHGVAIGALLADGRIDIAHTRELVELAHPLRITFHRAFDETPDKTQALEDVIEAGADCVLTSGGAPNVLEGADQLGCLYRQAAGRIDIMPGGGLRLGNLVEVLRTSGVTFLHGSLSSRPVTDPNAAADVALEATVAVEDVREAVRLMLQEITARAFETATQ